MPLANRVAAEAPPFGATASLGAGCLRACSAAPERSLACFRRLAERLTATVAACCGAASSGLLLVVARNEPDRRIFGKDGSLSGGFRRGADFTVDTLVACWRLAPESTDESRVPPGRRCRGEGDLSRGLRTTVAEI